MMAKAQQEPAVAGLMKKRWEEVSRKIAELAEAFPSDKLESTPVEGTRTIGGVLRHVAFWNHYVADSLAGRKADDSTNELPAEEYRTKKSIVEALRKSAAEAGAALDKQQPATEMKAAETAVTFLEHTSEHYGQLVVYARMMGIVPPSSRT